MIDMQSPATGGGAAMSSAAAPKILFADDEEYLREFIATVLLDEGYQIQAASNGYEAVTKFTEFQPDLVILDVHMPLMNGSDACAIIRQKSDVPIIMFTSAAQITNVKDAISNGTTDFVLKTTGFAELAERVASHLEKRNNGVHKLVENVAGEAVVQVSAPIPEQLTSTTVIVDPDEQNQSLIKEILTRLSQNFIEVETAAEAVSAIEQHHPDIIVAEWSLPDSDAAKLLTGLKRDRNAKKLIAIVMANHLAPEIQRKLKFAGIDDLLSKPLDLWKAQVMIGGRVKRARKQHKRRASKSA